MSVSSSSSMLIAARFWLILVLFIGTATNTLRSADAAFHVVLAGGTGPVGQAVAAKLETNCATPDKSPVKVTMLTRNAFLAAAPNRVTEQFGWVGDKFLARFPDVSLRDWDGGDLLDIVGQDWVGWQDDTLPTADVVVHLVGGFTPQRVGACERLVRESLRVNQGKALQLTVNPIEADIGALPPAGGMAALKKERIEACEAMVQANCPNAKCLRIEAYRVDQGADAIVAAIQEWAESSAS